MCFLFQRFGDGLGIQTPGRQFQSPKDKGIYLSVLLRPDVTPDRLMPVTAMAGL